MKKNYQRIKQALLAYFFVFSVWLICGCTQANEPENSLSNTSQNSYNQIILGTWKDSNSVITYFENKQFDGWFGENNKRFRGYYNIVGDTFKMNFPSHQHYPEYIVETLDSTMFKIKSLDDDVIFTKLRVKFVK